MTNDIICGNRIRAFTLTPAEFTRTSETGLRHTRRPTAEDPIRVESLTGTEYLFDGQTLRRRQPKLKGKAARKARIRERRLAKSGERRRA